MEDVGQKDLENREEESRENGQNLKMWFPSRITEAGGRDA